MWPSSGSKWNADIKIDKAQHRRDILGFRTSARPDHENKKTNEDARKAKRKEKRQNAKPSSWSLW